MVKKGAIAVEKEGRAYTYYPIVNKEQCFKKEREAFLDRVFGGNMNAMMMNFIKNEKLSGKEIEELKSLLADKEKEQSASDYCRKPAFCIHPEQIVLHHKYLLIY